MPTPNPRLLAQGRLSPHKEFFLPEQTVRISVDCHPPYSNSHGSAYTAKSYCFHRKTTL